MKSRRSLHAIRRSFHDASERVSDILPRVRRRPNHLLRTLGWISAGTGALGLGLLVGRELRRRYKFNRRTPYDVYAHSGGGYTNDVEFGVGI